MAAEAELPGRGRREVVLAGARVGAAVDHRHADATAVVAQRDLGAARQRLVGDAQLGVAQRAAAPGPPAVEAGAVPRGDRLAVDVQAPDPAHGAIAAGPHEHARTRAHRVTALVAQPVAPLGAGAVAVDRAPAVAVADLQVRDQAGDARQHRAPHDGPAAGADVDLALADADLRDRGRGRRGGGALG